MTERLNQQWAQAIIGECIRQGSRCFFLAPGSRCTPLTIAIANQVGCRIVQHLDERGLAFACQGFGRASDRPGVFVCTSGTAAANAFPAVVEASQENVPMLLLTADRPPELRDRGANQTIDQCHLFGRYVRWFYDLPCPGEPLSADFAGRVVRYAVECAADGPVHINCMFREPFGGGDDAHHETVTPYDKRDDGVSSVQPPGWHIPGGDTLVVLGGCRPAEASAVADLAARIGAPLLADVTSGVRSLACDLVLYRSGLPVPRNVIHLGGRIVSKRLLRYLQDSPLTNFWHVWPFRQRIDPSGRVTRRIETDIRTFCQSAIAGEPTSASFRLHWEAESTAAMQVARAVIDSQVDVSEPVIARIVAQLIPDGSALFLGNSMPVRAMDSFGYWPRERSILVGANRGASGIDGVLASAIGFAHGSGRATTLIIGDLSLLHDLNSLAMLSESDPPLVVVVVNNDGGGIFHFLPIFEQSRHFERFFATPHGRNFDRAAAMFGINYCRCSSAIDFRDAYQTAVDATTQRRSTLIEVTATRPDLVRVYRQIETAVRGVSP
jgi:2-succinyl-5-enolpyruvyl-6-hydroxy-3-cyclohexene-1-carboxylate synthase